MANIDINIMAGLGNRLFMLAIGLACAHERPDLSVDFVGHEQPSCHSCDNYQDLVDAFRERIRLTGRAASVHPQPQPYTYMYRECPTKTHVYVDQIMQLVRELSGGQRVLVDGYFQSPRYFHTCADEVERILVGWLVARAEAEVEGWCLDNRVDLDNAFFVHVRLGDFVGDDRVLFGDRADRFLSASLGDWTSSQPSPGAGAVAVVVSNEPEKVRTSHPCVQGTLEAAGVRTVIVGPAELGEAASLLMMSRCALGGVVPSSTFSWWGAWLLKRKYKDARVYTPDPWSSRDGLGQCELLFEPVRFGPW